MAEKVEFLKDGKRDWDYKKQRSQLLAQSLRRISKDDAAFQGKAFKVETCGDWLEFHKQGDIMKLHRASFCKYRLCPMCAWRRSLKNFSVCSRVMEQAKLENLKFIFLTLTIKNCAGEKLGKTITKMLQGWKRLYDDRTVRKSIKGYVRTLEVTHNLKTDMYHPHIHVVLAVKKSYFNNSYISQKRWTELWRQKMRIEYNPIIHVQKVRKNSKSQGFISEISKYVMKDADILVDDFKQTDKTVKLLDRVLFNRRLIEFGGRLRQIKKDLGLIDDENLININDDTEIDSDLEKIIIKFRWNIGYKRYIKNV